MNWQTRYSPPNPSLWQGRATAPPHAYFFQHMRCLDLTDPTLPVRSPITFAIIGFVYEAENLPSIDTYPISNGPHSIRRSLATLPLQSTAIRCYDVGDITCIDQDLAASQSALAAAVALLLTQGMTPIVLGGSHELAWGHYQGIEHVIPPQKRLGIINFDAHFDLRPSHSQYKENGNTAFYEIGQSHQNEHRHFDYNCIGIQHSGNIRQSFDVANHFNTKVILADELHQGLQEKCFDFIDRIIDENDFIYMSLSLDVFASAFAPGVKAIQPLGLTPWQVIPLIRQLAASGKVIGYDIAEHSPSNDIDYRTAKLAAILIDEIIHHHREQPNLR